MSPIVLFVADSVALSFGSFGLPQPIARIVTAMAPHSTHA
jgi:hypothetical protein